MELIEIALNSSSQAKETNKARPFNPFLCASSEKMRALLLEIQQQVEGYESHYKVRTRARKAVNQETFERILESLICDLCISVLQP